MALSLTTSDLARVQAANRALLSPLAAPGIDAWRDEAMRTVCEVVGAESATFVLPRQPEPFAMYGKDRSTMDKVKHFIRAAWLGEGPGPVAEVDHFHRLAVQQQLEVWDLYAADRILGGNGAGFRNQYAFEVLFPESMIDTNSLFVPLAEGTAHLAIHTFQRMPDPGEHLPVLGVLLPAFKAGLDAVRRLDGQRHALDALDEPVAVFSPDGRAVYRNAALGGLLAADPHRERVEGALRLVARGLLGLAFGRRASADVVREVATARGRYRLRGLIVPPGPFGDDGAGLVTVAFQANGPALPPPEAIRARHGLTKREAEVALLLAEGLSNEALAERLFVSKHTARHHVESILLKLDVPGRAAVAARLMQPA